MSHPRFFAWAAWLALLAIWPGALVGAEPTLTIKQATVGHGSADKNQMAFMIRALLGLTETPGPDEADALAIGLTHLRSQEAARLGVPGAVQI